MNIFLHRWVNWSYHDITMGCIYQARFVAYSFSFQFNRCDAIRGTGHGGIFNVERLSVLSKRAILIPRELFQGWTQENVLARDTSTLEMQLADCTYCKVYHIEFPHGGCYVVIKNLH